MLDTLLTIYHSFRIQDFFDIIIISALIYVLLIWFKRSASRLVFGGIILLGTIYTVARLFHLYLTSMVFQGFFAILLIALVVIFQEEIRRFFERLATWGSIRKIRGKVGRPPQHKDVEILVESIADLAAKKIGALIVLQGRDPLGRHLKGGYELDGILSQPLLASIFDVHSIGHDGAVIIDKSRVVKFGCHLPLSLDANKFARLGLRHTAALGLSERCDALCIVVSEERGTITTICEEQLKVIDNPTKLSVILEKFYEKKSPSKGMQPVSYWVKKIPLRRQWQSFLP